MAEQGGSGWPSPAVMGHVDRSASTKTLTTLAEWVEPQHTALIIVDMQNDYCSPGGASDRRSGKARAFQEIIPPIKALLEEARRCGVLVVFIQMGLEARGLYNAGPDLLLQAKRYGVEAVTIKGTWGHEIVSELQPLPDEMVVEKHRSSAFTGTDLNLLLRSNGICTVVITGVVTNGCILATTIDAIENDYYTVLCRDCVASSRQDFHDAILLVMEAKLPEKGVCDSTMLLEAWQRWRAKREWPVAVRAG